MQYMYYEKVLPLGASYTSRNWTEETAVKRDSLEYVKGRAKGMVKASFWLLRALVIRFGNSYINLWHVVMYQIDDDISYEHRELLLNPPDTAGCSKGGAKKKDKRGATLSLGPKSSESASMEDMLQRVLEKMSQHINKTVSVEMDKLSTTCAEVRWLIFYVLQ